MVVLIVDDSRAMRQIQRKVLSQLGTLEIVEASDGVSAIYQMRDRNFAIDLILLDWMMPRMNGLDLVKLLKSRPNLCSIPILMVTSNSEEPKIRIAWRAGVDGYLLKPFTREMFLQAILALAPSLPKPLADTVDMETKISNKTFFDELQPEMQKCILDIAEKKHFAARTQLVGKNQMVEHFWLVLKGEVEEIGPGTKEEDSLFVQSYGPGECFGVTQFMTEEILRHSFVTVSDCQIVCLQKVDFETMLLNSPEISLSLSRYLASKARQVRVISNSKNDENGLVGSLEVLDLPDLIQALNIRQSSGIIELPQINSYVAMSKGQVISVKHPECEGEEAFLRIVAQNPKNFKFQSKLVDVEPNIHTSTTGLLLNCMKEFDEKNLGDEGNS